MPDLPRRCFLRTSALGLIALAGRNALAPTRRLLAAAPATAAHGPFDDVPFKVQAVLQQHFGDRQIQTGHVQLDVPTVAADGRVVPVMIDLDLPMGADNYAKAIHLLVDNNPDIYLAGFQLTPAIGQAFIHTRIKMRMTSPVRAIVETSGGELWGTATDVRVTVNGCG